MMEKCARQLKMIQFELYGFYLSYTLQVKKKCQCKCRNCNADIVMFDVRMTLVILYGLVPPKCDRALRDRGHDFILPGLL